MKHPNVFRKILNIKQPLKMFHETNPNKTPLGAHEKH